MVGSVEAQEPAMGELTNPVKLKTLLDLVVMKLTVEQQQLRHSQPEMFRPDRRASEPRKQSRSTIFLISRGRTA
jgi:hypothetical protein